MSKLVVMVVAMVIVTVARVADGQQTPECASKLTACVDYLNTTKPPDSCCKPLRDTVEKERDCLCKLYSSGLLESIGINVTQALLLPKNCGISSDISACRASAPTPGSGVPPATPGGATSEGNNGAGKISWTGLSSLLMFGASVMLC